jgi:hypothetical protein
MAEPFAAADEAKDQASDKAVSSGAGDGGASGAGTADRDFALGVSDVADISAAHEAGLTAGAGAACAAAVVAATSDAVGTAGEHAFVGEEQMSEEDYDDDNGPDSGAKGGLSKAEALAGRRQPRDSIHLHRRALHGPGAAEGGNDLVAAALAARRLARSANDHTHTAQDDLTTDASSSDQAVLAQGFAGLTDVVQAAMETADAAAASQRRPYPPALPNEVQFEVTYFTTSLGLRLKYVAVTRHAPLW